MNKFEFHWECVQDVRKSLTNSLTSLFENGGLKKKIKTFQITKDVQNNYDEDDSKTVYREARVLTAHIPCCITKCTKQLEKDFHLYV